MRSLGLPEKDRLSYLRTNHTIRLWFSLGWKSGLNERRILTLTTIGRSLQGEPTPEKIKESLRTQDKILKEEQPIKDLPILTSLKEYTTKLLLDLLRKRDQAGFDNEPLLNGASTSVPTLGSTFHTGRAQGGGWFECIKDPGYKMFREQVRKDAHTIPVLKDQVKEDGSISSPEYEIACLRSFGEQSTYQTLKIDTNLAVRRTVIADKGRKARVVSSAPAWANLQGGIVNEQLVTLLKFDPHTSPAFNNNTNRIARLLELPGINQERVLFSADLDAATDHFPLHVSEAVVDGINEVFPTHKGLRKLLVQPHTVCDMTYKDGNKTYVKNETRQGILMGLGLVWPILNITNRFCAHYSMPADKADNPTKNRRSPFVVFGDDLLAHWTPERVQRYKKNLDLLGLVPNETKEVVSKTWGVFCGNWYRKSFRTQTTLGKQTTIQTTQPWERITHKPIIHLNSLYTKIDPEKPEYSLGNLGVNLSTLWKGTPVKEQRQAWKVYKQNNKHYLSILRNSGLSLSLKQRYLGFGFPKVAEPRGPTPQQLRCAKYMAKEGIPGEMAFIPCLTPFFARKTVALGIQEAMELPTSTSGISSLKVREHVISSGLVRAVISNMTSTRKIKGGKTDIGKLLKKIHKSMIDYSHSYQHSLHANVRLKEVPSFVPAKPARKLIESLSVPSLGSDQTYYKLDLAAIQRKQERQRQLERELGGKTKELYKRDRQMALANQVRQKLHHVWDEAARKQQEGKLDIYSIFYIALSAWAE